MVSEKKVSVSVSENLLSEKNVSASVSKILISEKGLGLGTDFVQNFGIVIQCEIVIIFDMILTFSYGCQLSSLERESN